MRAKKACRACSLKFVVFAATPDRRSVDMSGTTVRCRRDALDRRPAAPVRYTGHLTTELPEGLRLLMFKEDGTLMIWADGGGRR